MIISTQANNDRDDRVIISIQANEDRDDRGKINFVRGSKELVLQVIVVNIFIKILSLLFEHIQSGRVFIFGGLLEQLLGELVIMIEAQSIPVHVAQVNHGIAVL